MSNVMPQGPFCQSCGMPLEKPEDFGTSEQGFRVNDYCRYCFLNGHFTDPNISLESMIEKCVTIMTAQGIMPEDQARVLMTRRMPLLKRWKGTPLS